MWKASVLKFVLPVWLSVAGCNFMREKPLRVVITGDLDGYLNDCHCPGGQPGGLARRKAIFDRIRSETPGAFFIDCGSIFRPSSDSLERELGARLMDSLKYDVIFPAPKDPSKPTFSRRVRRGSSGGDSLSNGTAIGLQINPDRPDYADLMVWITNFDPDIPDSPDLASITKPASPENIKAFNFDHCRLAIFGGRSYVRPTVEIENNEHLIAYPGQNGGYVLVLDFTLSGGKIEDLRWEAVGTKSINPDADFQRQLDSLYAGY